MFISNDADEDVAGRREMSDKMSEERKEWEIRAIEKAIKEKEDEIRTVQSVAIYAQPYSLVLNELGEVAVVCTPCSYNNLGESLPIGRYLQLMRPVMLGLETATRCENCGALGPMVSHWGDDESYGDKVILGGALKPYEMPEIWEEGSDYNGHV